MRKFSIALGLLTGTAFLALPVSAGSPPSLSGGILGKVQNGTGIAQMGASVLLFDRYDQLVRRTITNEEGKFAFALLNPDSYTLRVTLASFVPAFRRNIAVAAGSENFLEINLTSLFSTIDIVASGPARGALMSDDWKWVLRSSQATRPVLRFMPGWSSSTTPQPSSSMFSDTTGILMLSAGDGDSFATGGGQQAMGTAFALATSVYGNSRFLFSGNVGYSGNSGLPTAGFRTSYSRSRDGEAGPQVTLTARQLYLTPRGSLTGVESGPALRTVSLSMRDKIDLADHLRLDYGFSMESVSFIERLNYASPFARATYDLGSKGLVRFGYASGGQPTELAVQGGSPEGNGGESVNGASLNQDLAALTTLPRVSMANDVIRVQRTQNFEMGYQRVFGGTTFTTAAYRESVANAAFLFSGASALLPAADSMPDLGTNSQIFNAGSFNRVGYTAAVKQSITDHVSAAVAGGSTGGLTADASALNVSGLRSAIRETQSPWMTASVTMTVPASGTKIQSAYGWTDPRIMMPDHYYMTGDVTEVTGWNIRVRQPLPFFPGIAGRLEATAELRNMLAQGYLPLSYAGQKAVLTNAPRAVRGGLAFIF
jgi:Carboxypeptidase regulatory-like domain